MSSRRFDDPDDEDHRRDRRPIEVHFHWPDKPLHVIVDNLVPVKPTATKAHLTIGGQPMPAKISIDAKGELVGISFTDDHGDPTDAPAGGSVTFASDTPAVAVITGPDPGGDPWKNAIGLAGVGTATLTATLSGATRADGTPIPDPDPEVLNVTPGPAFSASLGVTP